jgi:hypothetical protein
MKKLVAALAAVVAMAAIAVGTASGTDGPLFQDSEFACGVLDRDGSFVLTFNSEITWYASGKIELRCEGRGTPGNSVAQTSGFLCGLGPFGAASESKNVVRKNGGIQLTCSGHLNPGEVLDSAAGGSYGAAG